MKRAVVVFSGGQDSTTCLFWALKRYKKVIALSFDYHQKHVKHALASTKKSSSPPTTHPRNTTHRDPLIADTVGTQQPRQNAAIDAGRGGAYLPAIYRRRSRFEKFFGPPPRRGSVRSPEDSRLRPTAGLTERNGEPGLYGFSGHKLNRPTLLAPLGGFILLGLPGKFPWPRDSASAPSRLNFTRKRRGSALRAAAASNAGTSGLYSAAGVDADDLYCPAGGSVWRNFYELPGG